MNQSMEELNEHTIPPGGWQFYQPETRWRAPTPIASTLNQTIMLIREMRMKNPAITAKFKLATNTEAIKMDVLKFNRKRLGLPLEGTRLPFPVPPSNPQPSVAGAAAGVSGLENLRRAAQGSAVVLDWLGAGATPVAQDLAEKRAFICVKCPKNSPGSWYTEGPAELIKKAVETWKRMTGRADFEFQTRQGDRLKSCDVCRCLMPLKVFVPLDHILDKTKPEVMAEFPEHCWIKKQDR